jgi:hypothetical protein
LYDPLNASISQQQGEKVEEELHEPQQQAQAVQEVKQR